METTFSSTAKGLFKRSIPPIFFRGNPPPFDVSNVALWETKKRINNYPTSFGG